MANAYMTLTTSISKSDAFKAAIRAIVADPKTVAEQADIAAAAAKEALVKAAKGLKAAPAKKDKAEKKAPAKKAGKKAKAEKADDKPAKKEKAAKKAPKKAAKKK